MKIIVVGGGIGGLAAYLALKKYLSDISPPVTIKICESHPDPTTAAATVGGLGLAPNGMRAISDINGQIAKDINAKGFHVPRMTIRNAKGQMLGHFAMATKEQFGFDNLFVARKEVYLSFIRQVPENVVTWGRKVTDVTESDAEVKVMFDDGSFEEADIVVGADGVRSIVRAAVLGDGYEAEYQYE
jgi:2-polyprenyl-6-methoxyphenol hydroxylase-like FAD-dependent oxidoreductase